jgi:hypothetical protein
MTAIEELKESTRDSLAAKQRTLSELVEEHREEDAQFRDALLDIIADALAMYRVTVAQARAAQSVDEVAALWKETHAEYASLLSFWTALDLVSSVKDAVTESILGERLNVRSENPRSELFAYLKQVIQKLERASAQAYEFHA